MIEKKVIEMMVENKDIGDATQTLVKGIVRMAECWDKAMSLAENATDKYERLFEESKELKTELSTLDAYRSDNSRLTKENTQLKSEIDSDAMTLGIKLGTDMKLADLKAEAEADAVRWQEAFEVAYGVIQDCIEDSSINPLVALSTRLEEAGVEVALDVELPEVNAEHEEAKE